MEIVSVVSSVVKTIGSPRLHQQNLKTCKCRRSQVMETGSGRTTDDECSKHLRDVVWLDRKAAAAVSHDCFFFQVEISNIRDFPFRGALLIKGKQVNR